MGLSSGAVGEDKSGSYGSSMEVDKRVAFWENFGGGLAGCTEGVWRIEACEVKIGGLDSRVGSSRKEKE